MQKFKVKLPKKPKISNSEDNSAESNVIKEIIPEIELYQFEELTTEEEEFEHFDESFFSETPPKVKPKKKKVKNLRPVFSAFFSIQNFDKPIDIDLRKVHSFEYTKEELQEEIQKAYDKGFEDGQQLTQMALAEEFNKFEDWVRRFDQIAEELNRQYQAQIKELGNIVVPIAVKIAEQIIRKEVQIDKEILLNQIQKSFEEIENEQVFQVRIHPDDYKILEEVKSKLVNPSINLESLQIVADSSVDIGSCIVETSVGRINASFSAQLNKIKEYFENVDFNSLDFENYV